MVIKNGPSEDSDQLIELEFYGPFNTIKIMSSRSVYQTTPFLGSLSLSS